MGSDPTSRNYKIPIMFDLRFDQDIDAEFESRTKSKISPDHKAGGVYRSTLVQAEEGTKNWVDRLFHDAETSGGLVREWQAVHMCEETHTLVFCCNGVICLLKGYKRFFQNTDNDPDWFAAYRLHTSEPLVYKYPSIVAQLLSTEGDWVRETNDAETSLSVQDGRALWVSTFPFVLDWRSATSAEDVSVNLLLQDYESIECTKRDAQNKVEPSTLESASEYEQFRLRQHPGPAYKFTLRASSCAVLTETAAYIVEAQARRTKRRDVSDACRGAYGPELEQGIALRTVRCFDWARSALLRFDKSRCHAEIEAFTELPIRQTVQSTSDYEWSPWSEVLLRRIMRYENGVETFGDEDGEHGMSDDDLNIPDAEYANSDYFDYDHENFQGDEDFLDELDDDDPFLAHANF